MTRTLQDLIDAAEQHGKDSEPDHEVGDLQDLLRACFDGMTEDQRAKFLAAHAGLVGEWPKPDAPGVYACCDCGSHEVESTAWVDMNTGEPNDFTQGQGSFDNYCANCARNDHENQGHPSRFCCYMLDDAERSCTLCAESHPVPNPEGSKT